MSALPIGVARLYPIEDSGPLLRLDPDNLPDLDNLMLWMASIDRQGDPRTDWDLDSYWPDLWDAPTKLEWKAYLADEVHVGCHRIVPCSPNVCGDHSWHVHPIPGGEDWPESRKSGVFFGVWE